jgi:hypothetical protein
MLRESLKRLRAGLHLTHPVAGLFEHLTDKDAHDHFVVHHQREQTFVFLGMYLFP